MENKKTSYNSQTYNVIKAFLYALPIYISLIGIVFLISIQLHAPAIGVMGWIIISSVPFIFQKKYKMLFTRRVELEFDKQNFLTKEYTIKSDVLVKELTIAWTEIQSYKWFLSSEDTTYLIIYLKDGPTHRLSFKEEKTLNQNINEKSVFSIFQYYVSQYNSDKQPECKITLKPNFLITKSGAFVIYSLVVLAIVGIFIHIVLAPKTFALSFMSFFIIIGLLVNRKTGKDLYNKISQLEPRPPID